MEQKMSLDDAYQWCKQTVRGLEVTGGLCSDEKIQAIERVLERNAELERALSKAYRAVNGVNEILAQAI